MIKQGATILFQGDSITDAGRSREPAAPNDGLGAGYAMMAAAQLLADHAPLDLKIWNRGISGNKVNQLRDRWDADCLELRPDVLSILIGVNDCCHAFGQPGHLPVAEYEAIYRELLARTRQTLPEIKLILCEPFFLPTPNVTPALQQDLDDRRDVVKRLADEHSASLVQFQRMFTAALAHGPAAYWAADGVHPSYGGHMLMAREWLKAV